MTPTKVTLHLQNNRVQFRWLPHQTEAISVEDAAQQRGIRTEQMVKCILLRDMGNNYALACVPGDKSVDPKKVRALLGWRRMTCVGKDQVKEIIDYDIGTVTPLCIPQHIPIVFDDALFLETEVTISSGSKMAGLALTLSDLVNLVSPTISSITR
ncbi:YbaK/EbsC family protein [Vibrio sp.]|nr:YbaK/EbsC family protein [Vibrio sp.]